MKTIRLMGRKRGMTQRYDETGNLVVCTVIHAEPNVITQIKRKESDGYNALQIAYDRVSTKDPRTLNKRFSNQLLGHYKKANVEPRRYLAESRVDETESFEIGQELTVNMFAESTHIDVSGLSQGKGFQGVMKRHNFSGGPAAHGSRFHRHAGSTGMRSTPGRCLPGTKKPGRMGNEMVTIQSLPVLGVDEGRNLIFVKGSVPGPSGGVVWLKDAVKKRGAKRG